MVTTRGHGEPKRTVPGVPWRETARNGIHARLVAFGRRAAGGKTRRRGGEAAVGGAHARRAGGHGRWGGGGGRRGRGAAVRTQPPLRSRRPERPVFRCALCAVGSRVRSGRSGLPRRPPARAPDASAFAGCPYRGGGDRRALAVRESRRVGSAPADPLKIAASPRASGWSMCWLNSSPIKHM